jgi:hypothetical protein
MTKTTLSILTSILLSTALTTPGSASMAHTRALHHFSHFRGSLAARFADRFSEPDAMRARKAVTKSATRKTVLLDPSYTIIEHLNADPTWGTRVNAINESVVVAGEYVDKDDGTVHAFLRMPDGSDLANIHIGNNDTFVGFLNDKNETFGSYVDSDTDLENAWVRTKDGAVIPLQLPDGTGGSNGQCINNKGVLLGNYLDGNGALHDYIRTRKGTLTELADAPNAGTGEGQGTNGICINNKGVISGAVIDSNNHISGFLRSADGNYLEFEAPGAGPGEFQGTFAAESSDKGRTNGAVVDANDVNHGFIRDPDGNFTIVDAPDAGTGPGQGTIAVEHCEAGWCVGEYLDSNDVSHGYYCTDNCKTRGEIVEFDPPGAGGPGTYVVISSNKAHQIAGTFKDDGGIRHGFIRNP